eukprot:2520844-Alexandrium_andersonii.AAC.1
MSVVIASAVVGTLQHSVSSARYFSGTQGFARVRKTCQGTRARASMPGFATACNGLRGHARTCRTTRGSQGLAGICAGAAMRAGLHARVRGGLQGLAKACKHMCGRVRAKHCEWHTSTRLLCFRCFAIPPTL